MVRKAMPSRAWQCPRTAAAAVAFLTAACRPAPCSGDLVVTSGPRELVGLRTPSVPYGWSPSSFLVEAPIVTTHEVEWDMSTCPQAFVGTDRARLRGAIVIFVGGNKLFCSPQQTARALESLGAAGFVPFERGRALADPMPGIATLEYCDWDSDSAELASVQVNFTDVLRIIRATERGAEVAVRITPSADPWEPYRRSALWHLWQVVFALHCLLVLEMAVCRLVAFVRADRGIRPLSTAQLVLGLEVVVNALRLVIAVSPSPAMSPLLSIFSFFSIYSLSMMISTSTTLLYLHYFTSATRHAGVATLDIRQSQCSRGSVLALSALLVLTGFTPAFVSLVGTSVNLLTPLLTFGTVFLPLILTAASVVAERRVAIKLRHLIKPVLTRLIARMRAMITWSGLSLVFALLVSWAYYSPLRFVIVIPCFLHAQTALSYVQVDTFMPLAHVPVGPLRRLQLTAEEHLSPLRACRRGGASKVAAAQPRIVERQIHGMIGTPTSSRPGSDSGAFMPPDFPVARPPSGPLPPVEIRAPDPRERQSLVGITTSFLRAFAASTGVQEDAHVAMVAAAVTSAASAMAAHVNGGRLPASGLLPAASDFAPPGHSGPPELCVVNATSATSFRELLDMLDNVTAMDGRAAGTVFVWIEAFCRCGGVEAGGAAAADVEEAGVASGAAVAQPLPVNGVNVSIPLPTRQRPAPPSPSTYEHENQ